MQIGDVTSVQPIVNVPCLEREVKRAVQEMSISNEVPVAEGQGDGHDGASEEAPAIVEVGRILSSSHSRISVHCSVLDDNLTLNFLD